MDKTMTIEQVLDALRNSPNYANLWSRRLADAIDAHLASQPAEQPRGELDVFGQVDKRRFVEAVNKSPALDALIESEADATIAFEFYRLGYAQPKPEQAVGDGVEWISRAALPRVNPAQMVRIAQMYARADTDHAYTKVTDFMPHDWVVAAMCTAYDAGRQNIIDGTHTDGFTPEAIESVRRIFTPRPAVATPADEVLNLEPGTNECSPDPVVREAWADGYDTGYAHGKDAATPAEVTDALADALAKLVCEPGKPEYRDQARAALAARMQAAQCQVRKDGEVAEDVVRGAHERYLEVVREGIAMGVSHVSKINQHKAMRAALLFARDSLASPSAGAVVPEEDVEVTEEMLDAGCLAFSDGKYENTRKETDRVRRIIEAALIVKSRPTTASDRREENISLLRSAMLAAAPEVPRG